VANQRVLELKQSVINEIRNTICSSSSVIFFDYRGLADGQIAELRKKLKDNDSDMKVYKNTLTKRALDELKLSMEECVVGPNAIAFGKDSIGAIKVLTDYAKDHEILKIKGGVIDGEVSTLELLSKLATVPSRETLLTMLASGMISAARNLSIALKLYAESKTE
jgi:large subunit ribosomal protein L10